MNPEPPAYIPHCYFHLVQEVLNFPDGAGTRIQQENHDVSISDNQTLQQNRFVLFHFFQIKSRIQASNKISRSVWSIETPAQNIYIIHQGCH